jgi:menaquinol-cytochrome c reductase iron-sulfur subunit
MSTPAHVSEEVTASVAERRSFLRTLLVSVGGLVSATLAFPLVRFATFPLRVREDETSWSDVGKIDEFVSLAEPAVRTINVERTDGWRSSAVQNGVYVVPGESGKLKVLSSVCPHLGCAVRWIDKKERFICPCHGGTFTKTGVHVAGPPLRAMDELESKVENGILKVRFQYFRELAANKEPVA